MCLPCVMEQLKVQMWPWVPFLRETKDSWFGVWSFNKSRNISKCIYIIKWFSTNNSQVKSYYHQSNQNILITRITIFNTVEQIHNSVSLVRILKWGLGVWDISHTALGIQADRFIYSLINSFSTHLVLIMNQVIIVNALVKSVFNFN